MIRFLSALAATGLIASAAPASPKPCRDAQGRVVPCTQPKKTAARCKDDKGRFVACDKPGARSIPKS
ncbi:hypothetical protein [uncultured Sphingomonas sp.]|uniref:hypothetical protein n=1 Tax=uncultured Sphingomonas sp. TaxID=158754 RepID=UPI0035CC11E7